MEKISGILSPSARVTSVDLEDSQPSRPGSPNIGQKQGVVRINDRFNLSQQAKELASKETVMGRDHKDTAKAKIVSDMSRSFFETRVKGPKQTASEIALEAADRAIDIRKSYNEVAEASEPAADVGSNLSIEA